MARSAVPEDGTDAGPERPNASPGEGRPADLTGSPVLDPAGVPLPDDPTLRGQIPSEDQIGSSDPPLADNDGFVRPHEPADVLVDGTSDSAEEVSPVRFWDAEAGPAEAEIADAEPSRVTELGPDEDLSSRGSGELADGRSDLGVGATTAPAELTRLTAPAMEAARPGPVPARRGGAGALLLGGLIAAALGFGAAWLAQDRFGGARLPIDIEERLAALEARPLSDGSETEALDDRITALEARVAALDTPQVPTEEAAPAATPFGPDLLREEMAADLARAEERAAAIEERLAALEARSAAPLGSLAADPGPALRPRAAPPAADGSAEALAALEPRLAAVENGLTEALGAVSDAGTALQSLEDRVGSGEAILSDLGSRLDGTGTQLAQAEARLDEAEARLDTAETRLDDVEATGAAAVEEARAAAAALAETQGRAEAAEAEARREAAIAALDSALDAGEPFEAALPALGPEAPEALTRAAPEGVASLATLRETFPEAARTGLATARAQGLLEEGGVTGFLFGQLSVRSTAPREGSDPDAVLSRAEGALARGRLDEALGEVESLPEPVRAAMDEWIAQARTRAEAERALRTLRAAEPPAAPAD